MSILLIRNEIFDDFITFSFHLRKIFKKNQSESKDVNEDFKCSTRKVCLFSHDLDYHM